MKFSLVLSPANVVILSVVERGSHNQYARKVYGSDATMIKQIYDFMNVQSIHNKTFADALPATFLNQARELANYHEYGVFTDTTLNGIGNSECITCSLVD